MFSYRTCVVKEFLQIKVLKNINIYEILSLRGLVHLQDMRIYGIFGYKSFQNKNFYGILNFKGKVKKLFIESCKYLQDSVNVLDIFLNPELHCTCLHN